MLAAVGEIPIEDIEVGDYVWAWDEETGDLALKRVVEKIPARDPGSPIKVYNS